MHIVYTASHGGLAGCLSQRLFTSRIQLLSCPSLLSTNSFKLLSAPALQDSTSLESWSIYGVHDKPEQFEDLFFAAGIVADWVNPSKRGGMDGVFRGLAGLLGGIPEKQPCQPKENPRIYILFQIGFIHFPK